MKQAIHADKAPAAVGPYSQAVWGGDTLYISGQLPIDQETGEFPEEASAQTTQALKNIQFILEEAGLSMTDVVNCQIFVTDLGDFAAVNEAYGKFFAEPYPSRCCFEVCALPKGVNVEISATAVK